MRRRMSVGGLDVKREAVDAHYANLSAGGDRFVRGGAPQLAVHAHHAGKQARRFVRRKPTAGRQARERKTKRIRKITITAKGNVTPKAVPRLTPAPVIGE